MKYTDQGHDSNDYYTPRSPLPVNECYYHALPRQQPQNLNDERTMREFLDWKMSSKLSSGSALDTTIFDQLKTFRRGKKFRGWLVVVAGFLLHIPMMGLVMSFGEMLNPMLKTFQTNMSSISWIGSLAFGMAYVANPLSTPLYNRFGCRWVSLSGVVMGSSGLFVTSYVKTPWLLYVTYSLPFGIGTNFCYNPPLILTGEWFPVKRHVISTCTLVAGIPFGSLIMNPIASLLITTFGLQNAFRILAVMAMLVGILCCLAFKQPSFEDLSDDVSDSATDDANTIYDTDRDWLAEMIRKETNPTESFCFGMRKDLWMEPTFILYLVGQFTKAIGYVFPFIHLVSYMLSIGLKPASASLVMAIKGSADVAGRLFAGVVGENLPFDLIYLYVACTGIMGVTTFLCIFASNFLHMAIYAVCIGFFNGVYNSLLFPTTTSLFNKDMVREAWAYCQVPPGIAIILGPGIAGLIFDATKNYGADFQVNTVVFIIATLLFACIPVITVYRKVRHLEGGKDDGGRPTVIEMTRIFVGIESPADDDYFDDEIYVNVMSREESAN